MKIIRILFYMNTILVFYDFAITTDFTVQHLQYLYTVFGKKCNPQKDTLQPTWSLPSRYLRIRVYRSVFIKMECTNKKG